MLKAYKYRIYPNIEQKEYFAKCFGCVRFIYNKMLSDKINHYKETGEILKNTPAQYKKEYPWLKEIDSLALANAQMNLDTAYKNFFRNKANGFPKYKSKKRDKDSFTTNNNQKSNTIRIIGNKIKIPKLKTLIKAKIHRQFTGVIKSATITKTKTDKYYISILVDEEYIKPIQNENQVGIDLGLSDLVITSDGVKFPRMRFIKKYEKRLAKHQRRLSKMKRGSNNYNKQKIKIAKIHEKIANCRRDYIHNISKILATQYGVVYMEDLSSKNLMKNHKLAKQITDVAWSEIYRQLQYKLDWNNGELIKIDKWFPSSQICSCCGHRDGKKDLSIREWTCPECGSHHDRDINASINILNEGKRIRGCNDL